MDERNIHSIKKHFEDVNAQKRVQEDIVRAHEDVTVTIGRAAQLFDFSESQLRDWENRGLLSPRRSKGSEGQRLYALQELDKLAMLKELVVRGGYSLGNIPPDIDKIWHSIYASSETHDHTSDTDDFFYARAASEHPSIDTRVSAANKEEYWRYYISQTLRITLSLVCEDIPATIAGIVLPVKRTENATKEVEPHAFAALGPCLIGWRDLNNTFHTFYDESPHFDFPTDFRVYGLRAFEEEESQDRTFVVLQRNTRGLALPIEVVEAVRQLLEPIYAKKNIWLPYFGYGMRNTIYPTTALGSINAPDSVLAFLADRIIDLGGRDSDSKNRWKFCCILLPRNTELPLQMRTLIVQAQSKKSPHIVDKTFVSPDISVLGLSLRAFQSIHMLFRSPISTEDTTILYRDKEAPINSVIAMPIGGEDDVPIGVLYVTSELPDAFGPPYQRVLRFMGRTIAETLETAHVRKQSEQQLRDIATRPRVINKALESYDSENTFISDIETLLRSIEATNNPNVEGNTSFISIDIDDLSSITNRFGDQILINLSKVFGDRIKNHAKMQDKTKFKMYHAYADRFYLMLNDTSLDRAREVAETLKDHLSGNYSVSVLPTSVNQPRERVELEKITVRLGVSSYKHKKLYEVLQRYPVESRLADTRSTMLYFLDVALTAGKQEGGNCIISWYYSDTPLYEHGRFALWPPKVQN